MVVFKCFFIFLEICFMLAVILIAFLTDWNDTLQDDNEWMIHFIMVLCAFAAVICQAEQQKIRWDE